MAVGAGVVVASELEVTCVEGVLETVVVGVFLGYFLELDGGSLGGVALGRVIGGVIFGAMPDQSHLMAVVE